MTTPLTAAAVADRLTYTPRTIHEYAKRGLIPPPIDASLPVRMWRWSVVSIEQYEAGEWKRSKPLRAVAS